MSNYFFKYLMKKLFIKYAFFVGAFSTLVFLYWPALTGLPIWDDNSFLFESHFTRREFPYIKIWTDFNWPLSVSIHKLMLNFWGENLRLFHSINLLLHFTNSILLYWFLQKMGSKFSKGIGLLFMLHPSNVVSVAWIIQFKTLLCFFFGLISLHLYFAPRKSWTFYLFSIISFKFSLLSKSASIGLPLLLLIYSRIKENIKINIKILPFLILSLYAMIRILTSSVTIETTQNLQQQPPHSIDKKMNQQQTYHSEKKLISAQDFEKKWNYVLASSHYYFWQVFLPTQNSPVKESVPPSHKILYYCHFVFLILLFLILWKKNYVFLLFAGHIMLGPFLGLVTAPYMNLTWVSDQHLYLVLPFFIAFFLELAFDLSPRLPKILLLVLIPFFCFKVHESTPYYKNEIEFYKASIEYDPLNLPIGYNLAMSYLKGNDLNSAVNIVEHFIFMADVVPELKQNRYYAEMFLLYIRLKPTEERIK
jgi:hypothetical protein